MAVCFLKKKKCWIRAKKSHKNSPKLHIFKSGFRALSAMQCCCLDSFRIEKKIPETSQKNILHQLTLNTLDRIRHAAFLSSFFDQGIFKSVFVWSSLISWVLCTKQHGSKPSLRSSIRFWSNDSHATNWKKYIVNSKKK